MPATPTTQEMGERHERDVAEALGGFKTRGSGNGVDKGDGAHHHDESFAFRWDCKSTKGKQIALTLAMVEKIIEQAGGERPAIPLRWYGNEMLTKVLQDWIAVKLADFTEILVVAREVESQRAMLGQLGNQLTQAQQDLARSEERRRSLETENASLAAYNQQAGEIIGRQRRELETPLAANDGQAAMAVPGFVPALPWTIIHSVHTQGTVQNVGLHYDEKGIQSVVPVVSVRVERSLGSSNRPRLIVNDTRVREGALYVDGVVRVVVSARDKEIEVG